MAAKIIQSWFRGHKYRSEFKKIFKRRKSAVQMISRCYKFYKVKKLQDMIVNRNSHEAGLKIQKYLKGFVVAREFE